MQSSTVKFKIKESESSLALFIIGLRKQLENICNCEIYDSSEAYISNKTFSQSNISWDSKRIVEEEFLLSFNLKVEGDLSFDLKLRLEGVLPWAGRGLDKGELILGNLVGGGLFGGGGIRS